MPKVRDYGYFLLHLEEQKASGEYMAGLDEGILSFCLPLSRLY